MDDMTAEELSTLERLKKKKCLSCGTELTKFCACEITIPPGWFAIGIYNNYLNKEMPPLIPSLPGAQFADISFYSYCLECGNISFWKLNRHEYDAMLNEKFQRIGYRFIDYHDAKWLREAYKDCKIPSITNQMISMAEISEKGNKGNLKD